MRDAGDAGGGVTPVCVCVRACVRASVRACVRACEPVCVCRRPLVGHVTLEAGTADVRGEAMAGR